VDGDRRGRVSRRAQCPVCRDSGAPLADGTCRRCAGRRLVADLLAVVPEGLSLPDRVAGHIPMMFDNIPAVLPQVGAKAINAIAVAGASRAAALPDVATVAEQGIEGFEASAWFGLVAPAKTPAPVLAKLQGDVAAILQMPDVRKRLIELGAEPANVSGEAFGKFLAEETVKWGGIIRASGAAAN